MSLHLYATHFPEPLPPEEFGQLLDLLPPHLQERTLKYRRWEDRSRRVPRKGLLLRIALANAGHPTDLGGLQYTAGQRPSLPGAPDFNISHSGNRAACMLSTQGRVGIDMEVLQQRPFEDFRDQFTEREWTAIQTAPAPLDAFYHFWTAKESLIKADGRGLGIPLQELDLNETMTAFLDGHWWSIHNCPLFDGYVCHFTLEGQRPGTQVPTVRLQDMFPADILGSPSRGWTRF